MNDALIALGIEGWKPALGALLLPPLPFVLMVLAGALVHGRRRSAAWLLWIVAALGIWLGSTGAMGSMLTRALLSPPPALSADRIKQLKGAPHTAIVVLGGGRRPFAPEYGAASLNNFGIERLRYGVWLARATALPLAFSGGIAHGIAHGGMAGPPEAEIAARIAASEFGVTLRWAEQRSRDTNENALFTLPLLKAEGIDHIVLVTHVFHMHRARAAFDRAAQRLAMPMQITAAPVAVAEEAPYSLADWLPSRGGYMMVNIALHEWLGRLAGA
ncbi:MAG: ElyC/SanA/YdcF family protein [Burkholderiaceae bacterium]